MSAAIATLLVDDDVLFRHLVKYELEESGLFRIVAEAVDGAKGVAQARRRAAELQLVLLDLEMPVMDGLAALPHLRAAAPLAKVVVLSMREDLEGEVMALGAAGYIHKSLGASELVRRLQAILQRPAPDRPVPVTPPARAAL